ncbi:MAG: J domain-containing protein [Candidatus Obscuribacterales bacterium]|nr:J domain-containing protein [Candidatus Obscuribacterales bacterium]
MMNEIHQAYSALGLEPGATFEAIKRRYRKLVLVWHPDRMTNVDAKREVEEELKKINLMFERLKKHFDSDHESGPSCRCQAAAAGPPPNNNQNQSGGSQQSYRSTGPSKAERRRREEEETRRRTAERERRQAQEQAARRAAEAARKAEANKQAAEEAVNSEEVRKQEELRWRCSAAVAVVFAGLILYCWLGCAVRDAGRAIGKQWEEFQQQFKPKPKLIEPLTPYRVPKTPIPDYRNPFAPPAPPPDDQAGQSHKKHTSPLLERHPSINNRTRDPYFYDLNRR